MREAHRSIQAVARRLHARALAVAARSITVIGVITRLMSSIAMMAMMSRGPNAGFKMLFIENIKGVNRRGGRRRRV